MHHVSMPTVNGDVTAPQRVQSVERAAELLKAVAAAGARRVRRRAWPSAAG